MTTVIERKYIDARGMTPAEKRAWRFKQLQVIRAKKHKKGKKGR